VYSEVYQPNPNTNANGLLGKLGDLCFVSSLVLADSFVLCIRHLRQAPKR